MPDRYLREGLLRSQLWNGMEAETQLLFVRLLLLVDDFGCYDGRDDLIASYAYPTAAGAGAVPFDEFVVMMRTLHERNLIMRYSNAGKAYIAIQQWSNDLRGIRRYPAPPTSNDLPGIKYRGKYGKVIGWANPPGSAEISILLDIDGRPAVPQPAEWRNVRSDYAPMTDAVVVTAQQSRVRSTATQSLEKKTPVTSGPEVEVELDNRERDGVGAGGGVVTAAQSLATTATATTATEINGEIKFQNGAFVGLTEEQKIKWQDMCNDISIPDQVARAAAWLEVNHAERAAIEARGEGFGAFLVRWLLREERSKSG